MTTNLKQSLDDLRQFAELSYELYRGIRRIQIELRNEGIEIPETLRRSLVRIDLDLDELMTDLNQMMK